MLFLLTTALAGDGPWTLNPGDVNLYVGTSHYRYDDYDIAGQSAGSIAGDGTVGSQSVLVATAGLLPGVEAEMRVPWESVRVTDVKAGACGENEGLCRPSKGLGDVEGYLKVRVLDEFYTAPLSVGVSLGARSGEAYANQRGRLTALGDGQTAVGGQLSVGRTASVGNGWYAASATGGYWYRLGSSGGTPLSNEVAGAVDVTWSPKGRVGIGPTAYGFHRLGGQDLDDIDFNNADCFAVLAASQVQVGGRLSVYANTTTVHISAMKTVWGRNNPTDTLALSAGVGRYLPVRER